MPTVAEQLAAMDVCPPWQSVPWSLDSWDGDRRSVGEVSTADFLISDITEVVAYHSTPDHRWAGTVIGIVRVADGRFVGWEATWDATGSGFKADASGGNAEVIFAATVPEILTHFTDDGRELYAASQEDE